MALHQSGSEYLLGHTDEEHERLIRQAVRLAPITEGFFREAGIGSGQRVLDFGSGVGDVAMLLAQMVGPSGEVIGVERDTKSIERARARSGEAGFKNLMFVQSDVAHFSSEKVFDAAVGRFILQFLSDPVAVLRSLSQKVRPGGVIAFQECSWAPFALLSAHLPLWSAAVSLMRDASVHSSVNIEMGPALFRAFQDAGLPRPKMRLVMELGHEPDFTRWVSDVVRSLQGQIQNFGLSTESLGNLDTLQERLQAEVASSRTVVPWLALVGAWCRTPRN